MRFLDVKTDYAFKKVFGSEGSKEILLSFLNALLDFGDKTIMDLVIVDPYQVPLLQGMKETYVDVKAKLSDGTQVIIEMQVLNVPGFEKRILYNAAKSYSSQLQKGQSYTLINPVIALTMTDFEMFQDSPEVISVFQLIEKERLVSYSGDIELVFVELPKFCKRENELENIKDNWIYFIKNAGSLESVPEIMTESSVMLQAFSVASTASLTQAEWDLQEKRHDFIVLQKESIQQALAEGLKQGQESERYLIAGNLLAILDDAAIAKVTGLSQGQVARLRDKWSLG